MSIGIENSEVFPTYFITQIELWQIKSMRKIDYVEITS